MNFEQISIFDVLNGDKEMEAISRRNIKILSLFSGIGAFEKAFDHLGIPYELVGYCEIDKYASKSYSAIHGVPETMNLGDITKVDEKALPKDIDLITYGFPCQDISLAGKQKGLFNEDGTQTRSGLFFEAFRIIEETQPRVAIAENVKNLVGKKFNAQFQVVLASLEAAGYNNYYKVQNAKDFGVPQNRERVFIVSIRKDIDDGTFRFHEGFPLKILLKDVLEDEVDEKYYLTNPMVERLFTTTYVQNRYENRVTKEDGIVGTPCARDYKDPKCVQIANLMPSKTRENPNQGRLYDKEGLSPTLGAMQGGNRQPFVVVGDESVKVREATKQGYAEAVEGDSINLEQPNSKTRRGRVGKQVAQILTTSPQQAVVEPMAYDEQNGYIRKDGCVGTLTTDGSSPKHNNRVLVWDGFNQRVRADQSCVGTLTQNCGAELKRNGQGVIEMSDKPEIQRIDIPQTVTVRKYPVDCKLLCECLRDHKCDSNFSNKDIAEALNVPITKVEHWFRRDDCFAIPDPDIWMELKALLEIKTDEFDESIMTFEEKEGVYEKSERHYLADGIAPTLTSATAGSEKIVTPITYLRIRKLTPKECFRLMGFDDEDFEKAEAVNSNTQLYKQAGNSIVVPVVEYIIKSLFKCGAI